MTSQGLRPNLAAEAPSGPARRIRKRARRRTGTWAEIAETRLPRRRDNTEPRVPAGPEQGRPQRVRNQVRTASKATGQPKITGSFSRADRNRCSNAWRAGVGGVS